MTRKQFIKLTRPRTLTAAFCPVILGASFAGYSYPLAYGISNSLLYSTLVLITVMGAQIAANIWNEYFDFKSGLDAGQQIGNSGSITRDGISPNTILTYGLISTLIAGVAGFSLSFITTFLLIPVGFICIAISFFYSAGPKPLSRTPFGDIASGVAMGFTITLLTAFLWAGKLQGSMLVPALPSLFLIASILMANNLRDMVNDAAHGRRTLAIVLGRNKSIELLRKVFLGCFGWILLWVSCTVLPLSALLALLSIIPAMKAIKIMKTQSDVYSMDRAMGEVAKTVTLYHLCLSLGLLIANIY